MDEVNPETGQSAIATVKGIFVNSHRDAIRKEQGEPGVERLKQLVGKSLDFGPEEEVPVQLEIAIVEAAVQIQVDWDVPADELTFEAGRLHLRNFLQTPWAKTLTGVFDQDFRFMMLHASTIAARVFEGIEFASEDLGPNCVKVIMIHSAYPTEHFRGIFQEWMEQYGHHGSVMSSEPEANVCEYVIRWD